MIPSELRSAKIRVGPGNNRRYNTQLKFDEHDDQKCHRIPGKPIDNEAEAMHIKDLAASNQMAMIDVWGSKYKFFSNSDVKRAHDQRVKAEKREVASETGWTPSKPGHASVHRTKAFDRQPANQAPTGVMSSTSPSKAGRLLTEEPQKHMFFNGGGNFSSRFHLQGTEDPWLWAKDRVSAVAKTPWEHHDLSDEALEKPGVGTIASFSVTNPPVERFRDHLPTRRPPASSSARRRPV